MRPRADRQWSSRRRASRRRGAGHWARAATLHSTAVGCCPGRRTRVPATPGRTGRPRRAGRWRRRTDLRLVSSKLGPVVDVGHRVPRGRRRICGGDLRWLWRAGTGRDRTQTSGLPVLALRGRRTRSGVAITIASGPVVRRADRPLVDGSERALGGPLLTVRLRSRPAAASCGRYQFAWGRCGGAARAARVRRHLAQLVEGVGVVGAQEVQGEDSNYHDQHDHGHKDNQDRSDHHTIPLIWPRGGASQTRAAICASLPRKCKHPSFITTADLPEQ